MNKVLSIVAFVMSSMLFLSNSSFARRTVSVTGSYIEARVGVGGIDTKKPDPSTISVPYEYHLKNGLSFGGSIGYLCAGNSSFVYGMEIGYLQYPINRYYFYNPSGVMKMQYKGNSFDALVVGKYYFNANWNVIGKIGVAYIRQKLLTGLNDGFTANDDVMHKVEPELSVGVGYDFNKNVNLNLTFTHIEGDRPKAFFTAVDFRRYEDVAPVNLLLLGISYHFV